MFNLKNIIVYVTIICANCQFSDSNEEDYRLKEEDYDLKEEDYDLKEEDYDLKEEDYRLNEEDYRLKEEDYRLNEEDYRLKEEDYRLKEEDYRLNEETITPSPQNIDICYEKCKGYFSSDDMSDIDIDRIKRGESIITSSGTVGTVEDGIVLENGDEIVLENGEITRIRDNRVIIDVQYGMPVDLSDEQIEKLRNDKMIHLDNGDGIRFIDEEVVRERDGAYIDIRDEVRKSLILGLPKKLEEEQLEELRRGREIELNGRPVQIVEDSLKYKDGTDVRLSNRDNDYLRYGRPIQISDDVIESLKSGEVVKGMKYKDEMLINVETGDIVNVSQEVRERFKRSRFTQNQINDLVQGDVVDSLRIIDGNVMKTGVWQNETLSDEDMRMIINAEEEQCMSLCTSDDECLSKCDGDKECLIRCSSKEIDMYYGVDLDISSSSFVFPSLIALMVFKF